MEDPLKELIEQVLNQGGTLDLRLLARLAEAYKAPSLKDRAFEALKLCAQKYADTHLGAHFELIPWKEDALYEADEFVEIYKFVDERTSGFRNVSQETIADILEVDPRVILILRMILGYSRDELSFILSRRYGITFSTDKMRELEMEGRNAGQALLREWRENIIRSLAEFLYSAAYGKTYVEEARSEGFRLRQYLLKIDPRRGWESVAEMAQKGLPYSEVLYQRYIGGIARQALDTSSSLKAEILEGPVEALLKANKIPFYKTGPREKVKGWEQAPDFLIPSVEDTKIVIEAKVAEDGGTARDKASRIERLARIAEEKGADIVAVIDGKGFTRINDVLVPIIVNCKGKIFSYSNLEELLNLSILQQFIGKA